MRISKLVGERLKEASSAANVKSHNFLLRAGFLKQVCNGIFSLLSPAQLVSLKIQNIIREEMNKVGGQEVLFPVIMPKEMWEKSGRYYSIGQEMVRFKDRNDHDMLLGMTHEEAAVHLCQNTIKSYDQLPFMIYQIQTKFRDEARPRAGLIRVREFTMKDAYSFHYDKEELKKYYQKVFDAYVRIFKRIGMKNFIAVKSDSGMMGGDVSHEFMLLSDIGEDSLVVCPHCDYKANMEVATSMEEKPVFKDENLQEVFTGKAKTIDEVCQEMSIKPEQTIKAVCYAMVGDDKNTVVVFIRGDKEVNEAKLKRVLGKDVAVKDLSETGFVKGNIGCVNLKLPNTKILYDNSLQNLCGMVTGANKEEYHLKGVNVSRDLKAEQFYDLAKVKENERCPVCGKPVEIKRGIEIGNIFQLGTKYTKAMDMTIAMPDGSLANPLMACYGIGVGRALASVAEESCDEKGLVWPMSIAPWQVYLCPLRLDNEKVKEEAEKLEKQLQEKFEVLYDDRNVSAGVKLTDSELMGIPIRVVVSPRSLENRQAEITIRKTGEKIMTELDKVEKTIKTIIEEQMGELCGK